MASAMIHCTGQETPVARVGHAGAYHFVTLTIDDHCVVCLPSGPEGPRLARAIAEALLTAATEQEIAQIASAA